MISGLIQQCDAWFILALLRLAGCFQPTGAVGRANHRPISLNGHHGPIWSLFIDFLLLAAHLVDAFNFGMIFVCSGPVNGQKAFPSWLLLVTDERQQLIDADVVAANKKIEGGIV